MTTSIRLSQDAIEALAQYDEETDEWQLPGLAFTGNALTKTAPAHLAAAASAAQQDHKVRMPSV